MVFPDNQLFGINTKELPSLLFGFNELQGAGTGKVDPVALLAPKDKTIETSETVDFIDYPKFLTILAYREIYKRKNRIE